MTLTETRRIGKEIFKKFNLYGWKIVIKKLNHTAQLDYSNRTISLDKEDAIKGVMQDVIDSFLHEIAHILCPPVPECYRRRCPCVKRERCHDKYWRKTAKAIGAVPTPEGYVNEEK